MLDIVRLRNSFDRAIKKVRRATFVVSFVTLSSLPSFISRVEAIEPETVNDFKNLSRQAIELLKEYKTVNPDGSVNYDVPKKEMDRLEREFKSIVDKLKKEVDRDIKNQNWTHAERLLSIFYNFLIEMGYQDIAGDLLELINKIHDDFASHINLNRPGIYTIKGSGKVYVVSEGSSRIMSLARSKASMDAQVFLIRYLNVRSARITSFGVTFSSATKEERGVHKFVTVVGFYKGGKVILDDGTELSEEDIAGRLERDGKFLPLR